MLNGWPHRSAAAAGVVCGAGLAAFALLAYQGRIAPATISLVVAVIVAAIVAESARRVVPPRTCRPLAVVFVVGSLALVTQRHIGGDLVWLGAYLGLGLGTLVAGVAAARPATPSRRARLAFRVGAGMAALWFASLTVWFGATTLQARWFGGGIRHGSRSGREVALTFDDGPNATTTAALLDVLALEHVSATFFLVGRAVDARPDIARDIVRRGNLVGNHSYSHGDWDWLDPWYPELDRGQSTFARHGLPCPAWFRPPHGTRTPLMAMQLRHRGMRLALWDVSVGDWALHDPAAIARRVLAAVHPGSIVDLHDGLDGKPDVDRRALVPAVRLIIDGLRRRGLRPVRLDVLLGGRPYVGCPNVTR